MLSVCQIQCQDEIIKLSRKLVLFKDFSSNMNGIYRTKSLVRTARNCQIFLTNTTVTYCLKKEYILATAEKTFCQFRKCHTKMESEETL